MDCNPNLLYVDNMNNMFSGCSSLTSLDLSSFDTGYLLNTIWMFENCRALKTVYVGEHWNASNVENSDFMFNNCTSIRGGKGTTYDPYNIDAAYAHIDGGPENPGYLSEKPTFIRGDVNGDGNVTISDVTALIDLLLGGGTINNPAADCNGDTNVTISDVTALIDYLLSGNWPN